MRRSVKRDNSPIRLIAEIKKASPSKGLIRADFSHTAIASVYEAKKVDAISVLTEEDFFQGKLEFLEDVKKIVSCPVLRKDFIFDEYQIFEARARNADAILLIAAILELKQAEEYLHLAQELGLSVLFEVHDFAELETALRIQCPCHRHQQQKSQDTRNRSQHNFRVEKRNSWRPDCCKRKRYKNAR